MESTAASESVRDYLQTLGLETQAAGIYLELYIHGPMTALELAKLMAISRPQIYRRLEDLQAIGLLVVEKLSYGSLFRALPLQALEATLNDRLRQARQAKASLADMPELLRTTTGISQVYWDMAHTGGSYKHFTALNSKPASFSRSFRQQLQTRSQASGLSGKTLTNASTVSATAAAPFEHSRTSWRRIDPELLAIDFEAYCLPNRLIIINQAANSQAVTEFSQPSLIHMFESLFEAHWKLAEPLTVQTNR